MMAEIPANESARLEALRQYEILDTAPESSFDDITRVAAFICGKPTAIMALVDKDRQWFKSKIGENATETPREQAFCAHTILGQQLLEVEDARADRRFADNPLVLGEPHIRFYAGAPLLTPAGHALGSLCVIDRQPNKLTREQKENLSGLARMVMTLLEYRRVSSLLASASSRIKTLYGLLPICMKCQKIRNDTGYWSRVEVYVSEHTEATFTHGMCPECATKFLADGKKKER